MGKCELNFVSNQDSELCPLPSVNSLQLSSITPNSFLVTWDSPDTNLTGLKGFIVAYHRLDKNDQVRKYRVAPTIRGFHVNDLVDNTLYLVCVVTRGSSYTRSPNEIVTTTSRKQQVIIHLLFERRVFWGFGEQQVKHHINFSTIFNKHNIKIKN